MRDAKACKFSAAFPSADTSASCQQPRKKLQRKKAPFKKCDGARKSALHRRSRLDIPVSLVVLRNLLLLQRQSRSNVKLQEISNKRRVRRLLAEGILTEGPWLSVEKKLLEISSELRCAGRRWAGAEKKIPVPVSEEAQRRPLTQTSLMRCSFKEIVCRTNDAKDF